MCEGAVQEDEAEQERNYSLAIRRTRQIANQTTQQITK